MTVEATLAQQLRVRSLAQRAATALAGQHQLVAVRPLRAQAVQPTDRWRDSL